jgi:adenylyltransferase/sulfurtransferase
MTTVSIVEALRQQIATCETQLAHLRQQLAEAEHLQQQRRLREGEDSVRRTTNYDPLAHDMSYGVSDDFRSEIFAALSHAEEEKQEQSVRKWPLDRTEYKRYGRQLIMPEIGLQGTILVPFL